SPTEVIVEVSFPRPAPGAALAEFSYRRGDLPIVLVATDVTLDGQGRIDRIRIVVGGVADRPLRAVTAEASLLGRLPDQNAIADAAELVRFEVDPPGDAVAGTTYRRQLSGALATRALAESVQRLHSGKPSDGEAR
ncbi:MAG: aerobic carbon-monoxide dehydrogenase medium subunit, partial [Pseudonocardiales bacterium]|nr:aerobic carbon-monoxide dehydrogenase medium subunit [Pseudonocardiales bacterium]